MWNQFSSVVSYIPDTVANSITKSNNVCGTTASRIYRTRLSIFDALTNFTSRGHVLDEIKRRKPKDLASSHSERTVLLERSARTAPDDSTPRIGDHNQVADALLSDHASHGTPPSHERLNKRLHERRLPDAMDHWPCSRMDRSRGADGLASANRRVCLIRVSDLTFIFLYHFPSASALLLVLFFFFRCATQGATCSAAKHARRFASVCGCVATMSHITFQLVGFPFSAQNASMHQLLGTLG